jgi:NADPH:quinone reductase-like Zn-dependent oxidoreductase
MVTEGPGYDTPLVLGVIETVGGPHTSGAFARLDAQGTLVSVGRASGQPITFTADSLRGDGGRHGRSLVTFFLGDGTPGLDADLSWLAARLADGRLDARVDVPLDHGGGRHEPAGRPDPRQDRAGDPRRPRSRTGPHSWLAAT